MFINRILFKVDFIILVVLIVVWLIYFVIRFLWIILVKCFWCNNFKVLKIFFINCVIVVLFVFGFFENIMCNVLVLFVGNFVVFNCWFVNWLLIIFWIVDLMEFKLILFFNFFNKFVKFFFLLLFVWYWGGKFLIWNGFWIGLRFVFIIWDVCKLFIWLNRFFIKLVLLKFLLWFLYNCVNNFFKVFFNWGVIEDCICEICWWKIVSNFFGV